MFMVYFCFLALTLSLCLQSKHLLIATLILEGMLLSLLLAVPNLLQQLGMYPTSTTLTLLGLGVCEASVALTMMVILSRSYGSDNPSNLALSW